MRHLGSIAGGSILALCSLARAQDPPTPDTQAPDTTTPPATPAPTPVETPPPDQYPPTTDLPPPTTVNAPTQTTTTTAIPVQPTYVPQAPQPVYEETRPAMYAWIEPQLQSQIGVGITIGGGIGGFTDSNMRSMMRNDVGGLWDARLSLGTHTPLAIEASYISTATELRSVRGLDNGTLVGTTVEGALRFNIVPHAPVTPYLFAGLGWQRYDVRNAKLTPLASGMLDNDNVLEVPMGAGISYRDPSGFTVDARGTFRAAAATDFVRMSNGDDVPLHTWEASAAVGYEF